MIHVASHGVISQGFTFRWQVAVAFRLCPMLVMLMGRAKARPAPYPSYLSRSAGSRISSQGPRRAGTPQEPPKLWTAHRAATRLPADDPSTGRPPPGQACSTAPGSSTSQAPGTHPARPCTQAGPVLSLAGWGACAARRDGSAVAHPGGRLSDWLAGPSSVHACWRAQVRPRARQAHIRESLGQRESVLTQVLN